MLNRHGSTPSFEILYFICSSSVEINHCLFSDLFLIQDQADK
ncbi:Uncharacterised protein [Vibrio cholerae]|nr:Uncharacterised protein [Vibrio cholerae]